MAATLAEFILRNRSTPFKFSFIWHLPLSNVSPQIKFRQLLSKKLVYKTACANCFFDTAQFINFFGYLIFFGILMLIILFLTPIILFFRNLNHIYLISFYLFWFLTINHAAMRTAAPAFFYALTLIKVKKPNET